MNSRTPFGPATLATILCGLMLGSGGCRKSKVELAETSSAPLVSVAPELAANGLGALPGAVYRSQAKSPIHWQPWTQETIN